MTQWKCTPCLQRSSDVNQNWNYPCWSYYRTFCSHLSLI